ncbi:MAG TPA: hypothetical protein VGI45_16870 [Terracidiphilus sp.]|jgi:hypothetical protein
MSSKKSSLFIAILETLLRQVKPKKANLDDEDVLEHKRVLQRRIEQALGSVDHISYGAGSPRNAATDSLHGR